MPATSITLDTTLAKLLLAAPEFGPVLKRLGVNPARDGARTLTELCESRGLEPRTVARLLGAMNPAQQNAPSVCIELMTVAQLCDHLEQAHRNLRDELRRLDRLTKVLAQEEAAHPGLLTIRKRFVTFQRRFKAHLRKESEHLFPAVRRRASSRSQTRQSPALTNPPLMELAREHNQADEALADLRILATGIPHSSTAPEGLRSIVGAVARLEHAIHEQIYKENQFLFRKLCQPNRRRSPADIASRGARFSHEIQR